MATMIFSPATWADVFPGGCCVFNPVTNCAEVRGTGSPVQSRPMGANQLYLSSLLAFGRVWVLTQDGITGVAWLTNGALVANLGEAIIGPSVADFYGPSDIDETYGQQCVMLGFDGECVVAAIQTSAKTWDRVRLAADGTVLSRLTQPITINGGQGTSQGFLWFAPAVDPAGDVVGWADVYRRTTIDGVTMLCAVTANDGDAGLTVGQPITGPPQVTGMFQHERNVPTSLFKGLDCNLFPHVCVDGDGWRVSTSLLNNQVALWTGTTADLPPYDGTTPLPPPHVTFTKPVLCGLFASPLKYGPEPPAVRLYPAQLVFLTSGDQPADVRKVYDGPIIAGLDKYDPALCAGLYLSTGSTTDWGPSLHPSLATARAHGQRCWAYYDGKGEPYPQALLRQLDAHAYPLLSGYALEHESVEGAAVRVGDNMSAMTREFLLVQPYYAPYLTVAETWALLRLLLQLANETPLCIGTAGFQVDRPQPAPYAFGPWEQPVRAASTAPESWVYAPKVFGGAAARLIMGAQ